MQRLERYLNSWSKAFIAITLLAALALFITGRGEYLLQREVERNLISLIDVIGTGLDTEYRHIQVYTNFLARRPEVVAAARILLNEDRTRKDLIGSPGQDMVRSMFAGLLENNVYQGFFIIAPDDTNLASSRDVNVGVPNLLREQGLMLAQAWSGKTLLSLPQVSDVPLPDEAGVLRENAPTMFAVAPIRDASGSVISLLTLRVNPDLTIYHILASGSQGQSGESYLFDRDGLMLSDSRFTDDLWTTGRLPAGTPAFGKLKISRPRDGELTRMATSATRGENGVDVDGYADYRGVPVVGAWRWLEDHSLGIAVEVDYDEVYQGLATLRAAVYGTSLTAAALLLLITLLSRQQREYLERQVEEQTRALRYQQSHLSNLFEHAPDGLITLDDTERITQFSARARAIFGCTEEAALGRPLDTLLAEPLPPLSKLDTPTTHEISGQRSDGALLPLQISLSKMRTEQGSFWLAIVRDVSESKRLENAMHDEIRRRKAAEQAQRRLLEAAGEGIFGTDTTGSITFINPAGARLLGYASPTELVGRTLTGPALPAPSLCTSDSPFADPDHFTEQPEESILQRRDGTWFEVEYSRAPLLSEGRANGAVVVFSDISSRKRAQQSLLLAENVFLHITEGIVVTDASGRILRVNRALCEMVGYSEDEIISLEHPPYRSGEHAPVFYQQMWDTLVRAGYWEGEIWNRRKNGDLFPTWQTIVAIQGASGETDRYVSVTRDITEQRHSEQRIHRLAYFDNLTGLPNRELFYDRFGHAIQRAQRQGEGLSLLFLDLDRFKNVNDSLGHPVGDKLLKAVAERLLRLVRSEDTIARLGGDEFTVLLESTDNDQAVVNVAKKIVDALSHPFTVDEHKLHIGTSVGISRFPQDAEDVTTLIKQADTAMYQAKAQGRSNFQFYSHALSSRTSEQVVMEANLHRAVANDEFLLHYQPQYSGDGGLVGLEALVRWKDPIAGLIPPNRFIPLAEENGLIIVIGEWVLRTACQQMRRWLDRGAPDMRVSVNLSGPQIIRGDIVRTVADVLAQTGLPAEYLELEVTETFVMDNVDKTVDVLSRLRALGVRIAIDDFGTGHSSLANLKRLPVDTLKIDRAFVRDIPDDLDDVAIARAIIALGRQLHLSTIAEGVETVEQKSFLIQQGCDIFQGFLFSRPLPTETVELLWQPQSQVSVVN